jgi:hypothetical protein
MTIYLFKFIFIFHLNFLTLLFLNYDKFKYQFILIFKDLIYFFQLNILIITNVFYNFYFT